ncbi:MAG: NAD(P)H-dependent oxidoreductase [Chloroflexi bacterium]|nr:NAD(P)H-dependent oxidoreductase [Chloroflexota bacterium]
MNSPKIVALGGTHRERSCSRAALQYALEIAREFGAEVELLDLGKLELPMYRADYALKDYSAADQASLQYFLTACRAANGMLWASPTYHGTVTGLFKNALDHMDHLTDDDPPYLVGKAIGLISINDSKTFSAMSNAVHELRAWLAPTHIVLDKNAFDAEMHVSDIGAQRRITRLVNELLSFTRR